MEDLKLVPVHTGPLDSFPASDELPDGVKTVKWSDPQGLMVDFRFNVVYDERDGETLHLQILMPLDAMMMMQQPTKRYPLIVYVPGSAWRRQMPMLALPRMIELARRGFAVAIVEYRPSDTAPFPAQVEDTKSAVRFMRKNAEEYRIDPDKVILYGDSSGGHTVVTAGITGDGLLDNGLYNDFSCSANCIIDSFGPTEISKMNFYPSAMDHTGKDAPEGMLIGKVNVLENPELAQKASPLFYLSHDKSVPPILILHGDRDQAVPFNQSVRLYNKLKELGKFVEMYKLQGAFHGVGGFNSKEAYDTMSEFISRFI